MVKLDEKIEVAKTCIHFNIKRDGNCNCYGYAPFDCANCTSYHKNVESEGGGERE